MSTRYRSNGELDFTRAAHDEQADAELSYGVVFVTRIAPSLQRGVWTLETRVYEAEDDHHRHVVVRQADYWPSAATLSFAAQLYQHLHKTTRMVENWAHDALKGDMSG
jgi:hypothetical protein